MPRLPTNYANTIIYKIVCKEMSFTDIYIGHTTSFKDRKREHKSRCNNQYPYTIYKTINDNGGWDNWEMIEIEKFPCNDANEARARERYWYEELTAKLNAKCPTKNIELQRKNNKLYLQNYNQTLTESQKIKKAEYNKEWKSQYHTCICGASVSNAHKSKHIRTIKHTTYVNEIANNI
jgi:hypothetical protein